MLTNSEGVVGAMLVERLCLANLRLKEVIACGFNARSEHLVVLRGGRRREVRVRPERKGRARVKPVECFVGCHAQGRMGGSVVCELDRDDVVVPGLVE